MTEPENNNTFVVQLLNNQHQTWQGTVTWLDAKRTQPFRSLLEMLKLMESAGSTEPADSGA